MLDPEQIERYSRQLILPGWGLAQQQLLKFSSVLVTNSLPSAVLYLAAAGVGRLGLLGESSGLSGILEHCISLNPDCRISENLAAELTAIHSGAEEAFTHAIVKGEELDLLAKNPPPGNRVPEHIAILAVDTNRRVIKCGNADSAVEFSLPTTVLAPVELAAGTMAATLLLRTLLGYRTLGFPDRLAANFGCRAR